MDTLKVHSQTITLVDQVEDKLLNYLKEKDIRTGDSIPNELDLAGSNPSSGGDQLWLLCK